MTSEEILDALQPIFQDALDQPDLVITRELNAHSVEDWDSLANINLATSIQKHFNIKFALSDLQELRNVGDTTDLIAKKLGAK
jgi:acyl carrier protein